jgi:ribonuclease P protein component
MNNEAHISAEQGTQKKDARISRSHENRQRPQSHQTTSPRRTKELIPLTSNHFPKYLKVRKRFEYQKISKERKRIVGRLMCVDWFISGQTQTRLGLTVSSKYAGAPERNRFKRQIREIFRTSRSILPGGLDLNVVPRQMARRSNFQELRQELLSLLPLSYASQS